MGIFNSVCGERKDRYISKLKGRIYYTCPSWCLKSSYTTHYPERITMAKQVSFSCALTPLSICKWIKGKPLSKGSQSIYYPVRLWWTIVKG